jgi:hypothetical protein
MDKEKFMHSADYELRYLEAGIDVLEDYLFSSEIYWPIGATAPAGTTPYPQLTLGGLLLAIKRAQARAADAEQQARLARIEEQIDAVRTRWRSAWGKKAAREYGSRLNLWRDFLEEYRQRPHDNSNRYAYEVRRRVQLQLLEPEADAIPQVQLDLKNGLDKLLYSIFIPGEFIWENDLATSFPADPFWYLYGSLRD